ncbi:cytochrome c556 [Rhodovulum iodosum]|uniref:Cytochrome c556 n=1 Tax=Rhodovulum iodosum TaxID=68291 RepID=A0ABV3Y084_9RHOB
MTMTRIFPAALIAAAALAAPLAQAADATDPTVKARQEAMDKIGKNMKIISEMAKGERGFDPDVASAASAAIAEQATEVPALFEMQADDPESTAKPAIWEDFDDFTAKAETLQTRAEAADVGTPDALRASLMDLGSACKSCHDDYRTKD